ncbi:ACP S-malonyltransferase [Lentisphaerota bacterium WC36G]|nr:ACP S-malonyltransferase [Lentisphaerae bacterium WC36]
MSKFFVFSGQGAQTVGMGKDLVEKSSAAAKIFAEADEVLGWSLSELCFEGPAEKLQESKYCQPAIYTMSCACLAAFNELYSEIKPSAVAGLSLGEYAALHAAGVFSFADGLKLVAKRGELMDKACKETNGGMASVLGGDLGKIEEICAEIGIDVANYNCPGQTVISGDKNLVKEAIKTLKENGFRRVIPLKVAGAYHSKLMATAGVELAKVLANSPLADPKVKVTQNVTGTFTEKTEDIAPNLVAQVAGSVRWEECVRAIITDGGTEMIEFGPGTVLTGLLARTDKEVIAKNINSAESLEEYGK